MGGTPEGELRQASPEKKREPQAAADTEILPTEPQIGNRLADETGEREARPLYRKSGRD
jgi:hypothetical protein